MNTGYRFIDHTADYGLEIWGADPKALFEQAAGALCDLIVDPDSVAAREVQSLDVDGADWADLMVNWLRELLNLWNVKELLVASVRITHIEETRLTASVAWERFDSTRHEIINEIKAVTYHRIEVGPQGEKWRAQVIFDI